MRWDEMHAAGHPVIGNAEHGSTGARRHALPECFATTPLCSPSRRQSADRAVRAHTMASSTTPRGRATLAHVSARSSSAPATRQGFSASGTWATTTARDLASHAGSRCPGRARRSIRISNVDGKRLQAKGYVTDVLTDYVDQFITQCWGQTVSRLLAHKAILRTSVQQDDGRLVPVPGQPGGFVAGRAPSRTTMPAGRCPGGRMRSSPDRQAGADAPHRRAPAHGRETATRTMRCAAAPRCCWAWTTVSAGFSPPSRRPARSTTPSSSLRAITATSTASMDSTRNAGWLMRRRFGFRCSCGTRHA
jgi:hypothetical protein